MNAGLEAERINEALDVAWAFSCEVGLQHGRTQSHHCCAVQGSRTPLQTPQVLLFEMLQTGQCRCYVPHRWQLVRALHGTGPLSDSLQFMQAVKRSYKTLSINL